MKQFQPDPELEEFTRKHIQVIQLAKLIPLEKQENGKLRVACVDLQAFDAFQDFEAGTDMVIGTKEQCTQEEFDTWEKAHIETAQQDIDDFLADFDESNIGPITREQMKARFPEEHIPSLPDPTSLRSEASDPGDELDSEVVSLINQIIEDACRQQALRVFMIPEDDQFKVFYEMEDRLIPVGFFPGRMTSYSIRRLLVMAGLDPFAQGIQEDFILYPLEDGKDRLLYLTVMREGDAARARLVLIENKLND